MTSNQDPSVTDAPQSGEATGPETKNEPNTAGQSAAEDTFDTSKTFADLGLPPDVLEGITKSGFEHPTKIQAALIPPALEGRHVLGQAKTGTGKTAAFGLPLLSMIKPGDQFASLVLVPTRELAIQVAREIKDLGRDTPLQIVPVYGGQRITAQAPKLEKGPEIVVGTPGRVMDLHDRRMLPYDSIRLAVLDEVDRMLDIGFRDDIRKILGGMRQRPQTMFVSATISPEIEKLARSYMKDPVKIVTSEKSLTVSRVKQSWLKVEPWDKKKMLHHLLTHEEPALTVVFCRTKRTVDGVTEFLSRKGIDAHAIHGDMYQRKRNQVMDALRDGSLGVLVASDLAARGLDVDGISHVINFDIPEDPEVYIHRIGRTARAGREGVAWTLVTPEQGPLLTNCEMLANIEIPQAIYDDFKPGSVPGDIRAERELADKRARDRESNQKRTEATTIKADDEAAFPGGLVPKAMPARRMQGKVRTRRR
ncbi:MAG: DEAD/DEAH box helicase [Phycisphaera sp.]|nr:DEAD/DEAH box helicase [Phycisphaera sp.]